MKCRIAETRLKAREAVASKMLVLLKRNPKGIARADLAQVSSSRYNFEEGVRRLGNQGLIVSIGSGTIYYYHLCKNGKPVYPQHAVRFEPWAKLAADVFAIVSSQPDKRWQKREILIALGSPKIIKSQWERAMKSLRDRVDRKDERGRYRMTYGMRGVPMQKDEGNTTSTVVSPAQWRRRMDRLLLHYWYGRYCKIAETPAEWRYRLRCLGIIKTSTIDSITHGTITDKGRQRVRQLMLLEAKRAGKYVAPGGAPR